MLAKNCQIEVYAGKLRRRSEENCRHAQGDRTSLSDFEVIDIVNASAFSLAKEMGLWLNFHDIAKLGVPFPSGVESQDYIKDVTFSSPLEIKCYMESLGFLETGEARFSNGDIEISDLYPRNVLKDINGDIYVIDANYKIL